MKGSVEIYPDMQRLCHELAMRLVDCANEDLQTRGHFNLALAGGTTPRQLYQTLSHTPYQQQLSWSHLGFYFGDERCVPHEDEQSNYRMAKENLLQPLAIDDKQVHPFATHLTPQQAAEDYVQTLKQLPEANGLPQLDLVLLGMGEDGHTASLFPHSAILEDERLAAAVYVEKLESWRLSLGLRLINNARRVWVLVSGENKARTLAQLQQPDCDYPINRIEPVGELCWFVDSAAAAQLERR